MKNIRGGGGLTANEYVRRKADGALSLWVKKYLTAPDDPPFISPPRRQLLTFVFVEWFFMFVAWLFTFNVFLVAAVPMWVWLLYLFYLFSKNVWRAYGYSRLVLAVATVIVNVGLFVLANLFRAQIASLLLLGRLQY